MKIELELQSNGLWFARYGERWDDCLTTEEALGVVASILYGGKVPYLKDEIQHALWDSKYGYRQPRLAEKRETT